MNVNIDYFEYTSPMETNATIIVPMNSVIAHNLPFLSRVLSIGKEAVR
jgi:hypothetical protein